MHLQKQNDSMWDGMHIYMLWNLSQRKLRNSTNNLSLDNLTVWRWQFSLTVWRGPFNFKDSLNKRQFTVWIKDKVEFSMLIPPYKWTTAEKGLIINCSAYEIPLFLDVRYFSADSYYRCDHKFNDLHMLLYLARSQDYYDRQTISSPMAFSSSAMAASKASTELRSWEKITSTLQFRQLQKSDTEFLPL